MNNMLTIGTFNSHGNSADRLLYIDKLMKKCDFLLIQEHWLHAQQIQSLTSKVSNVSVHGVSGMDSSTLLTGRPYGGTAILWNCSMNCTVTPLAIDSNRACGVKVELGNSSFLLYNVYMPTDSTSPIEYTDVLNQISASVDKCNVNQVVIGGDFNTDFVRTNSRNTRSLLDFIHQQSLISCISLDCSTCDYTYESKSNGSKSLIDHVIISENIAHDVLKYEVRHDGDNMSDHSPVFMTFDVSSNMSYINSGSSNCDYKKLNWGKASDAQKSSYEHVLSRQLNELHVPVEALTCDLSCTDVTHHGKIDKFYKDIVRLCLAVGLENIPVCRNKKADNQSSAPTLPGWSEIVEPARQTCMLWHMIWKDNGSPREGLVANIRRSTRVKYHLAIKTAKRDGEKIRAENMASNLLADRTRNFWSEVKKVRNISSPTASQVDGAVSENDISNVFSCKYKELYNSVSFDEAEMNNIISNIELDISTKCSHGTCKGIHRVSFDNVSKAMLKLKHGKQDGNSGLSTSHLIYGGEKLVHFLSLLFTGMLMHGYTPEDMLLSTIIPIPKNTRKSLNNSDNYRGIALASPVGKLLDWVFMLQQKESLSSSDYQFGYKANSSTTKCTFVVNEVVKYYTDYGSNVFSVLLDASKAFDRVHYAKLFRLLRDRDLCPTVCRYLALQYTCQMCCVKWMSTVSQNFTVSNGVKQGGVLSPYLFTLYMDRLLERLKLSGFGCHVGHVFSGAFAYADDLILLAPTRCSMKKMLELCEQFSADYDICFNPSKSKAVCFGSSLSANSNFSFGGKTIDVAQIEQHLGYFIGTDSDVSQIQQTIGQLNGNVNLLMAQFSRTNIDIKYKLFKSFCMSVYGSPLWNYSDKVCEAFYVAWRKCIRRLLNVPPKTHCALLNIICDDLPVDVQLHKRFIKFYQSCLKSGNICIQMCSKLVMNGSGSDVCDSLTFLAHKYNFQREDVLRLNIQRLNVFDVTDSVLQRAGLIRDLILYNSDNDDANVKTLIDELCVN